jgi:uncharacterized protein with PIN domain
VLRKLTEFWQCKNVARCGKVYWEGSKFEGTRSNYKELFEAEAGGEQ